jgi:hypothetical protein
MRRTAGGAGAHVLAEVDGQVGFAVGLIGGDGRAGHFGHDAPPQFRQPGAVGLAPGGVQGVVAFHAPGGVVVAEIEGSVFADHGVHGPHARDVVAPARRAPVTGTTASPAARRRSMAA